MSAETIEILARALDRILRERDAVIAKRDAERQWAMVEIDKAKSAPLEPEAMAEIARDLSNVASGSKIAAIKLHRTVCRSGLKEAKDAVEKYWPAERDK